VVATPEFKPLFLTIGQVAEEKASKCPRSPAVPFDRAGARKDVRSDEPIGEVIPTVGREGEVEVVGMSLKAIEANGMASHDKAAEASGLQSGDDGGEPFLGVQSSASSHPRLPCDRSICMSG
jgi:hypothetical protein